MKKALPLALFVLSLMFASCGPNPEQQVEPDPNDTTTQVAAAYWKFASGEEYLAANTTFNGTQTESDCDNNNKMWIILGAIPTASGQMKIVSYSKTNLASDELRIDIAHGGDDYLTTGNDNVMADIIVENGKISINFDSVTFARYGSMGPVGDSTSISGYLDQQ